MEEPFLENPIMCACAERRAALLAAAKAAAAADWRGLRAQTAFVAATSAVDAKALAARTLSAARARLAR